MIPETWFMLKSVSQVMRLCICLPFKDLNHDFQFSKLSVKKLLKGQTWGNTMGGSCSTIKFTFSSGNYVRVRRGGWTRHTSPLSLGKWGFIYISQHFGSDQEPLTSMQATNPAGHRRPGTGNNSHSDTDITEPHTPLTRMGMERLQNTEAVLPAQVCAKPHTPDDHRSGKGMLHFNISKTYPLFPYNLSCSHISKPHLFWFPQIM